MITPSFRPTLIAALLVTAATLPASASGSYSGRPPKPPANSADAMKMDREKYGLGQKIYEGGAKLMGGGNAGAQMARLQALQGLLPADAMKIKDLPALAGKLSAAELDALDHFVKQRFAMKK